MKTSGIGGQAVIEGIMMQNQDDYAVAVRKPDGEICVDTKSYHSAFKKFDHIPFVRGFFHFIDSLYLGVSTLMYSSTFFDEEEEEKPVTEDEKKKQERRDQWMMTGTVIFSLVMTVLIFMILPYVLSALLKPVIPSYVLRTLVEGVFRIAVFVLYLLAISRMEDIRRTFMYHGAEHKCINCVEHGLPLTVDNVRVSSREHKRCGTSFLFFVVIVSIILFLLIPVENPVLRVVVRILLLPVIAGISYELLRLAGRSDNPVVNLLSRPGMTIQHLTTAEPDDSMIEVAISAVEAVFDWRTFEAENFGTASDL